MHLGSSMHCFMLLAFKNQRVLKLPQNHKAIIVMTGREFYLKAIHKHQAHPNLSRVSSLWCYYEHFFDSWMPLTENSTWLCQSASATIKPLCLWLREHVVIRQYIHIYIYIYTECAWWLHEWINSSLSLHVCIYIFIY